MVYVENTGGNPCYVRIKLDTSVTFENEEDYVEPSEDIMMNIDSENWLNGNDGYYYYKKELLPGSFTEKLFDEVEFSKNMGNEYQGATISISVSAEAVQSENNSIGQGQSILEVKGWPGEPQTIRITSYNVCYTKLLRIRCAANDLYVGFPVIDQAHRKSLRVGVFLR